MLIKKMLRDLWKDKVQFGAIFIMMFIGIFIFSGVSSEYNGLDTALNNYIKESNMADGWVYKEEFSSFELDNLKDNYIKYNQRMLIPTNDKNNRQSNLDLYISDSNSISKLTVIRGINFNNYDDGIWLDAFYAKKNNYQLGDTITIRSEQLEITKKIVGLVFSPETIYLAKEDQLTPDREKYGFAYLNKSNFPLFKPNQLAIKSNKNITKLVDHIFEENQYKLLLQKDHPSVSMLSGEIDQHRSIGLVFSIAFLLIAVLITITTMYRVLQSQKLQIGILKALGFNNKKLLFHYLSHSTFICLLGSGLGYGLGMLILPALIYPMFTEIYVLPDIVKEPLRYGYLLPVICTLTCMLISFIVCHKYLKMNGANILYSNADNNKNNLLLIRLSRLPFRFLWNLRDIIRNKLRSIMTILGVLGCTALLFSACGLYDTMTNLPKWNYNKLHTYKYKINLDNNISATNIIKQTKGQLLMESTAKIKTNKETFDVSLIVLENNNYIKLAKDINNFHKLDEGIAISKKTADKLNINEGDIIKWKSSTSQKYKKSEVTQIIRTPNLQGITIMKDYYLELEDNYYPTSIIGSKNISNLNNLIDSSSIKYQNDLLSSFDLLLEAMILIIIIFVLGAVILGTVILYNLGVLSYHERYYEFATLKVLGFKDKQIQKILIQQNIWLSLMGIILGLPVGLLLIKYMVSTVQESMDIIIYIDTFSYLYAILGTLIISLAINLIISLKIKKINMVSSLKAND